MSSSRAAADSGCVGRPGKIQELDAARADQVSYPAPSRSNLGTPTLTLPPSGSRTPQSEEDRGGLAHDDGRRPSQAPTLPDWTLPGGIWAESCSPPSTSPVAWSLSDRVNVRGPQLHRMTSDAHPGSSHSTYPTSPRETKPAAYRTFATLLSSSGPRSVLSSGAFH